MAMQSPTDNPQVPLLDSFLHTLDGHVQELLVRLSKLYEVMDMLPRKKPKDQEELRIRLDLLIKQCSMELGWAIRTFNGYKTLRRMAAQQEDNLANNPSSVPGDNGGLETQTRV
ncbi:hypothetical protein FZEAL_6414 [Fusarium zealandicum]|uniref:Uncharacterized protein n=1 Tax=Fusarium zealandicum TaxID=1053134 RepID=A0A8H4UHU3_9HYPO|nr:hypothetical protein FZEAL_6414 [Fusarium zealandicum]